MSEFDPGAGGPALDASSEAVLNRSLDQQWSDQQATLSRDDEDRDWIERTLFGDPDTFGRLVERYFRLVHAIAYARVGSREAAEDLTQEVFLRVFLHLQEYDPARPFAPWLARIARNLSINWAKAGQRYSSLVTMLPHDALECLPEPARESERDRMERLEQEEILRRLVFGLPEDMREAVLLHYVEGLSKKEIAERTGVHPSTVGRLIERSLKALRVDLENKLRGSAPAAAPRRASLERTLALIAIAAALGAEAKAVLSASAGGLSQLSSSASTGAAAAPLALVVAAIWGLLAKFWLWLLGLCLLVGTVEVTRRAVDWNWLMDMRGVLAGGSMRETPQQLAARQIEEVRLTFDAMQELAAAKNYDRLITYYDIETWAKLVGMTPAEMTAHVRKGQPLLAPVIAASPPSRIWIDGTEPVELEVAYDGDKKSEPLVVPGPRIGVSAGDWHGRFIQRDGKWLLLNQQLSGATARTPGLTLDSIVFRRPPSP